MPYLWQIGASIMRSGIIAASYMRGEPFVIQATGITGTYSFQLRYVGTVKVDWGDGTNSKITSNTNILTRLFTHTYEGSFSGSIRIIGPNSEITYFVSNAGQPNALVTIDYSEFSKFKNLQYIHVGRSNYTLSGNAYDIVLPSLQEFYGSFNGSVNPVNTSLRILDHQFSGTLGQLPDELINLEEIISRTGTTYSGYIPEVLTKLSKLYLFGNTTLAALPKIQSLIDVEVRGQNTVSSLPSVIEWPNIESIRLTGQNTVTSVPNFSKLKNLSLDSIYNTISVLPNPIDVPNLQNLLIRNFVGSTLPAYNNMYALTFRASSVVTIEGSFPNITQQFIFLGNTGLVYDIANFQGMPLDYRIVVSSGSVTYSGGRTWPTKMDRLQLHCGLNSLTVDLILNELQSQGVSINTISNNYVYLDGNNAPRTSASDGAVLYLQGVGYTVITN